MPAERLPHLVVTGHFATEQYTYAGPLPRGKVDLPQRDRGAHGVLLSNQLNQAQEENNKKRGLTASPQTTEPITLEIRSEPGYDLKLDSLEDRRKGIEVACVRKEDDVQIATIHIPRGSLHAFSKKIEEYINEDTKGSSSTSPRPKRQELVAKMAELRLATIRSFWTEDQDQTPFPADDQAVWWEVWLRSGGVAEVWDAFTKLAQTHGLRVGVDTISFPDRVVGLVFGSPVQLSLSAEMVDMMAELRKARQNPEPFLEMTPKEQAEWCNLLLARITAPPKDAPSVCIFDSGVILNPLLQLALDPEDCHRYDQAWPLADTPGKNNPYTHGTEMAGVALYGHRLADLLAGGDPLVLLHKLESVRILPPRSGENDPRLYGRITKESVSRVEIHAPKRLRTCCLPVTTDGENAGKPSSWSGIIDQLCAGVDDENPRLFVISAGNTDPEQYHKYPDSNDTDSVQEPAQAWNAITVGAYTDLWEFDQSNPQFSGCEPLAPRGDLSPSSTTSVSWDREWPIKPDVVLEGGNYIRKLGTNIVFDPEQMAMLTTAHATTGPLLVDFRETSAAAAQAARMTAMLQAEYPTFWPETIRALLIHSAEWTEAMKRSFGTKKNELSNRLRRYGYGVPNLARAMHSARNSLTLVSEQMIQPCIKDGSMKTKNMGLHRLPWPKDQLLELGEKNVTMRVTLSYFIEPKPGRRKSFPMSGAGQEREGKTRKLRGSFPTSRHSYQSHGLRFEVRRPEETFELFQQRVSKAARTEEEKYEAVGDGSGWTLGTNLRKRGSVQSDWWTGAAAKLANAGDIAVYPVNGWWRDAPGEFWKKIARYSLVVTIQTEENTIDIYHPVKSMIETLIQPEIVNEIGGGERF